MGKCCCGRLLLFMLVLLLRSCAPPLPLSLPVPAVLLVAASVSCSILILKSSPLLFVLVTGNVLLCDARKILPFLLFCSCDCIYSSIIMEPLSCCACDAAIVVVVACKCCCIASVILLGALLVVSLLACATATATALASVRHATGTNPLRAVSSQNLAKIHPSGDASPHTSTLSVVAIAITSCTLFFCLFGIAALYSSSASAALFSPSS
mmetsp:Transcript_46030/g.76586  ORF Transcript_46030/g.76586 Transcript_46030/m.76586 type:complete len:209 (-) Transcript_46030:423-1049(-)